MEFVHASDIALQLTGDAIGTNLFMLGYAWQRGWVPVGEAALERAIELNGVAVEFNKNAFLLGRRFANQPELVESLLPQASSSTDDDFTLDQVIEDRFERLVAYQSVGYAQRYLDQIEKVRSLDSDPEADDSLTHTVAQQLFKLMAYKDEYEVARLHSDEAFRAKLDAQFTGNYSIRFHLAPPLLSRAERRARSKKLSLVPGSCRCFAYSPSSSGSAEHDGMFLRSPASAGRRERIWRVIKLTWLKSATGSHRTTTALRNNS